MGSFSELIKSFDKTRDYMRDFFIYGCKVRQDFGRKSARTYDDEKRRVESWLGDCLRYGTTERGRQVSISVDSGHVAENPLYRAYASRSFTDNDIRLHFLLLDLLAEGEALGVRTLTERLAADYGAVFDEQTVRGKLREYTAEGILIKEKQGRSDVFRLTKHTPQGLCAAFAGLSDALAFFSECGEFSVIGHTLLRAAGLRNDSFLMKHNYIVHTLEDEVLLQLVQAIAEQHSVLVEGFEVQDEALCTGVPLQIYTSAQTGRRWLILYLPKLRRFRSYRLDFIRRVKDMGACPDYAHYAEMLRRNKNKCFGVSFGSRREEGSRRIRMVIQADPLREPWIPERLEREKRCGTVTRLDETHYSFTAELFDPGEIMAWLKTYIGRITSFESSQTEERRFFSDIARMHRMYNERGAQDADLQ